MVLKVIEYHECYHDTPCFREKLCAYEKEVENTSDSIKGLVKEVRKVINATKEFSKAQLAFADVLGSFSFETVGERSEMEEKILNSFAEFAEHIRTIEEQRERLTDNITIRVCDGLEGFRKSCFSPLKEHKRAFEKTTEQFYGAMDKRMGLTIKKKDQVLQDSDKEWDHIKDSYQTQAFHYLECLQAVHERKVFECMEPILGMIRDTFTFYHQSYEESQNLTPLCLDLQYSIQLSRDAFDSTIDKAHELMKRVREKGGSIPGVTRGYLYISERKKGALGSWVRHYMEYHEAENELHMYSINPVGFKGHLSEKDVFKFKMDSCTRCKTEDVDRRFCFEIISSDKRTFLLQTDSLGSRRTWIEALGGKEPTYFDLETLPIEVEVTSDMIKFAQKCIATIEERGLDEEGIYRKSGMQAKISRIVKEVDKGKIEKIDFSDETENDVHTVSGCLKYLLAHVLPEPLFTFSKHEDLVGTGKISNYDERSLKLQGIIRDLPQSNQDLLKLLIAHLSLVAQHSDKNMMRASNVGVVFGPTLMRPRNETVQSIMNIKYQNIIVQQIIEDNQRILYGTVTITNSLSASTPSINRPFSQVVSSNYRGSSYGAFPKVGGPQPRFLENRQTLFIEPGGNEVSPDFPNNRPISSMPPRPPQPLRTFANQLDNSGSIKPPPLPDPSRKPVIPGCARPFSVMMDSNNKPVLPPKSDLVSTASSPFKRRPVHRDKTPLGARNSRGLQETLQSPPTQDSPPSVDDSSPDTPSTPGKASDSLPTNSVEVPSPPNEATNVPPVTKKSGPREAAGDKTKGQKARAIFDCDGENENELCFKKFDVFENVRKSDEPQWLFADLNGKRGLIPENYIEYIV